MPRVFRAKINPERLKLARLSFGFASAEACAQYVGNDALSQWKNWESGKVSPTWKQLDRISKKLVVSDNWLSNPNAPEQGQLLPEEIDDYRGGKVSGFRAGLRARSLQLRARANRMSVLALDLGYNRFWRDTLDVREGLNDTRLAAEKIRTALDLESESVSQAWRTATTKQSRLRFWLDRMAELGIIVIRVGRLDPDVSYIDDDPIPPSGHLSGMAIHHDFTPAIVLSKADNEYRQIFTLLHELAHLIRGKSACGTPQEGASLQDSDSSEEERFCDQVAQYVLLNPENKTVQAAKAYFARARELDQAHLSELRRLSKAFGVSQACLAYSMLPDRVRSQYFKYTKPYSLNRKRGGAAGKGPKSEEKKIQEWCSRVRGFWGVHYLTILSSARYFNRFDDERVAQYLNLCTFGNSSPPSALGKPEHIETLFDDIPTSISTRR